MTRLLRMFFFACVVRPVLMVVLGVHVRRRELLPQAGPAVIIANHNSHLDTLTLMSLYPLASLDLLRPAGAMDYFLTSRWMRYIAEEIIRILPVERGGAAAGRDPLAECLEALDRGEIVILFPEGSRGEPERLQQFKKGIAHLAKARPEVPVTPVFMHGLGKVLPKGTILLIPFNCDVFVGPAYRWEGSIDGFMTRTAAALSAMAAEGGFSTWE
jgi:1-acyl-sn-glycerol-3-phosphate acyltransferase